MILAAIVVTDLNNAIGRDNQLLCHLPADLRFFKATTMGFPIIMGRKTYESIGRPLKGRRNLVITRRSDYRVEGVEIYHHIDAAIASCDEEKAFIIGGAEIFTGRSSNTHSRPIPGSRRLRIHSSSYRANVIRPMTKILTNTVSKSGAAGEVFPQSFHRPNTFRFALSG